MIITIKNESGETVYDVSKIEDNDLGHEDYFSRF